MLKVYKQKAMKFNGLLYRARDVIADELYLERLLKVPEAIVVSSWRSLAEQKLMVANGKSKTLNSNHRRGMACDIVNWKELEAKLRKVGLMNDISWDRNHFAYDSESKATRFPLIDALPKKLEEYKALDKPQKEVESIKIVSKDSEIKSDTNIPSTPIQSVESGSDNQPSNNNMNLQGYRTYIGLAITLAGVLGATQYISTEEMEKTAKLTVELIGIAIAIYGRYQATKK